MSNDTIARVRRAADLLLLVALLARGKLSEALLPPVLAMIPVFWMACAIAARVVFPDSCASAWHLPFIGGAVIPVARVPAGAVLAARLIGEALPLEIMRVQG